MNAAPRRKGTGWRSWSASDVDPVCPDPGEHHESSAQFFRCARLRSASSPSPSRPSSSAAPRPAAVTISAGADPLVREECGSCHLAFRAVDAAGQFLATDDGQPEGSLRRRRLGRAGGGRKASRTISEQRRRHRRPTLRRQVAARVSGPMRHCASPNCRSGCASTARCQTGNGSTRKSVRGPTARPVTSMQPRGTTTSDARSLSSPDDINPWSMRDHLNEGDHHETEPNLLISRSAPA